jgi:hypothetical protein
MGAYTPPPSSAGHAGTAVLDFGAFPGASDASVAVTGQSSLAAGSVVMAQVRGEATADHSADEHMIETLEVAAKDIVPGTGFTIVGVNRDNGGQGEGRPELMGRGSVAQPITQTRPETEQGYGDPTRLYGLWSVGWMWV